MPEARRELEQHNDQQQSCWGRKMVVVVVVDDEFLIQDSLSNTSTSEETNFSTTGIGGKEVKQL